MARRIFISYATGDEDSVKEIQDVTSRLEGIEVCIPSTAGTSDTSPVQSVTDGINGSDLMVVLITFNSTNTMWLNQEIGYACAKKMPIIPVIERGIDVKGFLEGQEYVVFHRADFRDDVYRILQKIKDIFMGLGAPITNFRVECPKCHKKFSEKLPRQETTDAAINQRQKLAYRCRFCNAGLHVHPITMECTLDYRG